MRDGRDWGEIGMHDMGEKAGAFAWNGRHCWFGRSATPGTIFRWTKSVLMGMGRSLCYLVQSRQSMDDEEELQIYDNVYSVR